MAKTNTLPFEMIKMLPDGMPAYQAFELISGELKKDGLPKYDLGSYTAIEMPNEAKLLIQETLGKNLINQNEYQQTTKIHQQVLKIIGNLLHIPNEEELYGSSTTGSSEAIFMALLAAKWRWNAMERKGEPNIILCSNAHISWYKCARFLDIKIKEIALNAINTYPIKAVENALDESTIGVVAILGCTYLGYCDPIVEIDNMLSNINKVNKWDIGIHVDAAIGGFIYPFAQELKEIEWDFKLPNVKSINLSGHKYGLVYPGIGWLIFRDKQSFPKDLNVTSAYLSGESESFTISFSRSSALIVAQQFCFMHYGIKGYGEMVENCLWNASILSEALQKTGFLEVVSMNRLPVVAFKFKEAPPFKIRAYTALLREREWMLPQYQLSGELKEITVMRVVVRQDMSLTQITQLINDIVECYKILKDDNAG